jgi:hypothetical protein
MRANEFLLEAKPENLGQGMLDKLYASYQQKDANDQQLEFEDGLGVANYIYQHVGPNYLTWVCKQYNQDRFLFLHDLSTVKDDLQNFVRLTRDRRINIERDINRYPDINQLRDAIAQATGSQTEIGSKFYQNIRNAINEFVKQGQAVWLYKGNDYSIYHPKTFEASNICKNFMSTNVCTIMNDYYFKQYSQKGTLIYIITQDKLYNCYISKDAWMKSSEFADERNDHRYNLPWMLENFPALHLTHEVAANMVE